MVTRLIRKESYGIFLLAIVLSFAWHVFWLAMVKVVVAPSPARAVKFSRVSFLGPILSNSTASLGVEPKKLTLPERHYIEKAIGMAAPYAVSENAPRSRPEPMPPTSPSDKNIISMIDDAVSGRKLEPSYTADRRGFSMHP